MPADRNQASVKAQQQRASSVTRTRDENSSTLLPLSPSLSLSLTLPVPAQRMKGIPLRRKLCYALGGMPAQMTNAAMGLSLQIFLLDVVQMDSFYASLVLFLGQAWDAGVDPLVGYFVSKSGWTPVGKLVPWTFFSMPFGVLSYIMMWFVPGGSMSLSFSFSWYLITSCLFATFMSCYHVPYSSLNMCLGGDQRQRDSVTAYRMGMEVFATLLGAVIQGRVVGVYNEDKEEACGQLEQISPLPQNTPQPQTDVLQDTRQAYMVSALVLGAIYFLSCLVLFLGVKEQTAPFKGQAGVSYVSTLRKLATHTPYVRLGLGFLFAMAACQMCLGNFALFCSHVAGLGAYFQHLILVLLASSTLSVPVWQAVLVRVGKKTTLYVGLAVFIPALAIFAFVPSSLPVYIVMSVLTGSSVATLSLLPWSMLPDVVDDFKLQNPCCGDVEPMFSSCYVFFNKLAGGLSVGISTLGLHLAGYESGACDQGPAVETVLRILFGPVPVVLLLLSLVFFYLYPINEAWRQRVQGELEKAEEENIGSVYCKTPRASLVSSHQLHRPNLETRPVSPGSSLKASHKSKGSSLKTSCKQAPSLNLKGKSSQSSFRGSNKSHRSSLDSNRQTTWV